MSRQKFWQTQRFKDLQGLWEEKLKESGFIDAESNGKLCQNSANSYRTQIQTVIQGKISYYDILSFRCHTEVFRDNVEKYVMERLAEGISRKQIRRELKTQGKRNGRETVRLIIKYYETKWHLKKR